jgi:hypothetical protein
MSKMPPMRTSITIWPPSGITFNIQPGDFVAIAFDKPIIQEVEFATAPDHNTLDDVVYAGDNNLVFSAVPEPLERFSASGRLRVAARCWQSATPALGPGARSLRNIEARPTDPERRWPARQRPDRGRRLHPASTTWGAS